MSALEGPEPRTVVVAIWADGTIIWSGDRSRGGAPYFLASLPVGSVTQLLFEQHARLVATTRKEFVVPDSEYAEIALVQGDRLAALKSCIPVFESDQRLVATDHGIEALDGRERAAVLATQSREFREFRDAWTRCADALLAAIPPSGDRIGLESFRYAEAISLESR